MDNNELEATEEITLEMRARFEAVCIRPAAVGAKMAAKCEKSDADQQGDK